MDKLNFLILLLFLLPSCAESGHFDVNFSQKVSNIEMVPTRYLTTWNYLEIKGNLDCRVTIGISGENSIILEPGEINYAKRHEWFDAGNKIEVIHDGCSNKSKLRIYYNYNASYW
jgi:hypothetical protein